jgi:hypothetical protein
VRPLQSHERSGNPRPNQEHLCLAPVFNCEAIHPLKLVLVVGNQDHFEAPGMGGDPEIVVANQFVASGQIGSMAPYVSATSTASGMTGIRAVSSSKIIIALRGSRLLRTP